MVHYSIVDIHAEIGRRIQKIIFNMIKKRIETLLTLQKQLAESIHTLFT